MTKHTILRSLLLVAILIVLILLGRFALPKSTPQQSASSQVATTTTPVKSKESVVTSREDSLTTCAQKLKKDTLAAGTAYDKKSILASFTAETSYVEAVAIIANYGLAPYHATGADISYEDRHIITIAVDPGEEFMKICQLKANPVVKNAILNILFEIHE